MQFKNPEILWALLLLIIPIVIHLLQLRRFKKTAFTNVKMLQKVVSESRKSKSLKKWLLLATRVLLFTMLILAFAQPFFAKTTALQEKETVIYLDNSFSMQAKKGSVSLLENAVQDLLKNAPNNQKIHLFTNNSTYANTTLKDIRNELLALPFTVNQLEVSEVQLKAKTLFRGNKYSVKNLILISDFQEHPNAKMLDTSNIVNTYFIKTAPAELSNFALDSIYIAEDSGETITLNVKLSSVSPTENCPVSIYNAHKLIAKTSASFNNSKNAEVAFSINNKESVMGRIVIEDSGLDYDNQFFFSLNKKEKIQVLTINKNEDANFLSRIYTDEEFIFQNTSIKNLNYSILDNQNLIILNELQSIPEALQKALLSFSKNNGTIVLIPDIEGNLSNYNSFINSYNSAFTSVNSKAQEITTINFDHELFSNVFDKKVSNFQYPSVEKYIGLNTKFPSILSYANGETFLAGTKGIYLFTAPLSANNSNFKNSPLIVPTFYKMGIETLKQENLYVVLGTTISTDIAVQLPKDEVLKIAKDDYEFIPMQQPYLNKVTLTFEENPQEDGNYTVKTKTNDLRTISFNFLRKESKLVYTSLDEIPNINQPDTIENLFESLEKDSRINELWKWFVILAVLFALIEIGIQKYFK